jgi:hypothetical protein
MGFMCKDYWKLIRNMGTGNVVKVLKSSNGKTLVHGQKFVHGYS